MFRKALFLGLLIPLLAACAGEDLHLKIRFGSVRGLAVGDRIYFEARPVGEVKEILLEKGGSHLIHAVIHQEAAHRVTQYARFYVEEDPVRVSRMAIRMTVSREGGTALKDGATVQGSGKVPGSAMDRSGDLGERFEDLKRRLEDLTEDLEKIPRTEAFKRFERNLKRFHDEMKRSGDEALDKLEKEVMPWLEEGLNRFREWLNREFGDGEKDKPTKGQEKESTWT